MRERIRQILTRPKRLLILTLFVVVFTIGVDQALKNWAVRLGDPVDFLVFRFFPFGNRGIFGGYLANLDPWIVRIFFSVLFGFLVLGVVFGLVMLRHRNTPILKAGLVVYVSGVFGNVWDRMTTGTVVDYFVFNLPGISGMAYNFADAVVLVGAILIGVSIFREADAIWYAKNQRQGYWIDPEFQRGFGLSLAAIGFAHFFVIALYSFVFLKVYVGDRVVPSAPNRVIQDYLVGLCVIEVAALALTFAGSVFFSHRLVGPLLALTQFVERRKKAGTSAPPAPFRVRRSDYFRRILEDLAARL